MIGTEPVVDGSDVVGGPSLSISPPCHDHGGVVRVNQPSHIGQALDPTQEASIVNGGIVSAWKEFFFLLLLARNAMGSCLVPISVFQMLN